jgi:UDP:flavonoid glycosyltransferase YjiC (YdhE family)
MERPVSPSRIVLATYGSPGDLYPFLAIGVELRGRGHDVVVASSALYRQAVLDAGLAFAAVRPERAPGQPEPDYLDRLRREWRRPEQIFRAMFLPDLRAALEDQLGVVHGADLVLSHTLTPAAALAAEARGIPWLSTVMQPMGYLSAYEPPVVGPGWIAAALRSAGPRLTALGFGMARNLTARWTVEWGQVRAELGLPPSRAHPLWEGQHAARGSLGLFPRVLGEPQPDWPPQARVTGFPFYRHTDTALEPEVAHFLGGGEAPLVFTLGTTAVNDPGEFFAESVDAARRLGMRALLLVGRGRMDTAARVADGVLAAPYAPHHLIFPRASVIIHQGGIGTLAEALLAGKPMLIMPYAHDQFDNAWRAKRLGVARSISRRRYKGAAVSRALARLLDDPVVAQTATRAGLQVSRDAGAATAADLIEEALRRG